MIKYIDAVLLLLLLLLLLIALTGYCMQNALPRSGIIVGLDSYGDGFGWNEDIIIELDVSHKKIRCSANGHKNKKIGERVKVIPVRLIDWEII